MPPLLRVVNFKYTTMNKSVIKEKGIVGIGGYATTGKDLLCRLIKDRGLNVRRFALADKLKHSLDPFIQSEYGVSLFTCNKKEKELLRPLMVAYSKLHRSRTGGAYFANKIQEEVIEHSKTGLAIITDVRYAEFPETDELWWIKKIGGKLVYLDKYEKDSYGNKSFVRAPNADEAENCPKLKIASDYNIEWPHSDKGLSCLDGHVDNLVFYLNESLRK